MAVSKLRPFWSGFLIFSDFARGPIRLSALMEIPVVHVFTHDSIGVGEDGPTHQPVEQLVSLRAIPGLLVFRPADANEVAETWRYVVQLKREPAVVVLSRQALPTVDRSAMAPASALAKGAYVLIDAAGEPDVILIATGSEVGLALSAREELAAAGVGARVVSMPCSELFDRQPQAYRDEVLPPSVRARVAVEAAGPLGWHRWVGDDGDVVAMEGFGASAPAKVLYAHFGFTGEAVAERARAVVKRAGRG
jgi:transketolase